MTRRKHQLADHIRRLRLARSWPQDQLAIASGLSLRTIQRVERGLACSADTVQAIAAAFEIDTHELAALVDNAPAHRQRKLGLTGTQAAWVGLLICLPTLLFITVNFGYYELGWLRLEALRPSGLIGAIWSNPILLLGAPSVAIILNTPHVLSLRARTFVSGRQIDGLVVELNWQRFLVIAFAGALLGTLFTYLAFENLQHLIQDSVAVAAP